MNHEQAHKKLNLKHRCTYIPFLANFHLKRCTCFFSIYIHFCFKENKIYFPFDQVTNDNIEPNPRFIDIFKLLTM